MQRSIRVRPLHDRLVLALLAALTVWVAACSGATDARQTRDVAPPLPAVAPLEPDAILPIPAPVEPASAPVAAATSVPSPTTAAEATQVIAQAYREITIRLFREVRPSDLLTAGWRGVRDEARRQGALGSDLLQPFSDAGSGDLDSFLREFSLFVSGPGASLDAGKLAQAAIRSMTASIGDSHTRYMPPASCTVAESADDGTYAGIGVVTPRSDTSAGLVVGEVYAGSPAALAGLRPGDRIIGVDGADVIGRSSAEISCQIRGETGTTVKLSVINTDGETREMTLNRARISPPVIASRMAAEGIGYVRVSSFPRRSNAMDAAADFEAALTRLQASGAQAFVIDLRGNPGGDPTTSVDIASNLTQDGPIFVSVNRNGRRTVYQPNRTRQLLGVPVVVLIDGRSASGAEVVASAVDEYDAGYLIGTRTCGCLSVGQPLRLDDKSEIIVTVQQALTGRYEHSLEGLGLSPDEVVRSSSRTGADEPLDRAIDYLNGRLK